MGWIPLFVVAMMLVGLAWWVASPFTIRHARLVQRTGQFLVGWIKGLSEWWEPNAQLTEKNISPHFWPNGTMPNSAEFEALVADEFAHYRAYILPAGKIHVTFGSKDVAIEIGDPLTST